MGGGYDQARLQTAEGMTQNDQFSQFDVDGEALHDTPDQSEVSIVGIDETVVHHSDGSNLVCIDMKVQ